MIQTANEHSIRDSIVLCRLIGNLRNAQPQIDNDAILTADPLFAFEKSKFVQKTDLCSAYYIAQGLTTTHIVIDGTSTVKQTIGIVDGYQPGFDILPVQPGNRYMRLASEGIRADFQSGAFRQGQQVFIGGWSLGGGIANYLGYTVGSVRPVGATIAVYTFGAPRSSGTYGAEQLNNQAHVLRWMNDNDPVPLVPPRVTDTGLVFLMFGVQGAVAAANYVHPAGGVQLDAAGRISTHDLPQAANANFVASLANWILQWDAGGEPDHLITTYLTRLQAALALNVPQVRRGVRPAPMELLNPIRAVDVVDAERAMVRTVVNLERQQNAVPVVIPAVREFQAIRVSRFWYVVFNGIMVSMGGSKKGARHLARVGNEFLRALQTRPAVDDKGLLDQFTDYLAHAQQPGFGYQPLLNTIFPR